MDRDLILLTGASGYVGGRLRHALEDAGRPLRCMARRPAELRARVAASTEVVGGDVLDPASLPAALRGVHTATT
jgi:Nucleoside-diphosphate-sugar epimerases